MISLNFKKVFFPAITILILSVTIAVSSIKNTHSPTVKINESSYDTIPTADTVNISNEMRGIWVTYMELSMENESDKSENRFREKFEEIALNCKNYGLNTLIVQVRPFCDALYKSEYFPWSHIMTGIQGKNPTYDPLKIMCEICNSLNLELHAWINPYRISLNNTPSEFADNNPYISDNSLTIETDSGIILDPSNKKARELIINGVLEIVNNYDIDAIHFDDYFYPTDIEENDYSQYQEYVSSVGENSSMGINNWRKANVNMLICEVYRAIHSTDKTVKFGISPQGNIANNEKLYADVKSWCSCRGFIDYICPQIYFSLDNPALTFEDALYDWTSLQYTENTELYIGLAGYKAGTDKDNGTWLEENNILAQEYNIIKNNDKAKGFMLYSYSSLLDNNAKDEIDNLQKALN